MNYSEEAKTFNGLLLKYEYMKSEWAVNPEEIKTVDFFFTVRNKSELDLKNQPEWKNAKYFTYDGEPVRRDSLGNISHGYVGKVYGFSDEKLFFAAGLAQQAAGTNTPAWQGAPTYGDDPFDYFNIQWGINIYNNWHK